VRERAARKPTARPNRRLATSAGRAFFVRLTGLPNFRLPGHNFACLTQTERSHINWRSGTSHRLEQSLVASLTFLDRMTSTSAVM